MRCSVSILAIDGIVVSHTIDLGGDDFDEAIVRYVKNHYGLMIGEQAAEEIKITIGTAFEKPDKVTMDVNGRDLVTGLPKTVKVSSEDTREALKEEISRLVEAVHSVLERTPPELAADVVDRGIILVGGGALLGGLEDLLEAKTGVNVIAAQDPMLAVATGTGLYSQIIERGNFLPEEEE